MRRKTVVATVVDVAVHLAPRDQCCINEMMLETAPLNVFG